MAEHHNHHHHLGVHEHGDSTYSHQSSPSGARLLAIAVALTGGYAFIELLGGLWSGSLALLADAGHMATDAAALLFALAANIVARRPVTDRYSFGLARTEVIAAFVNALAMLAIVIWLFVEAIDRLRDPVQVKGDTVFAIAFIGLLINIAVAWVLSLDRANVNTRAAFIHVLGDLLGSVAAIAAGVIIHFTGFMAIDPLLSMLVGGLILRSTFSVLKETTLVLLDSVPEGVSYAKVGDALAHVPGVVAVHDLHIWSMVPGRGALSAHVLLEDMARWPAVLRGARDVLAKEFKIDHVTLQPECLSNDRSQVIPIQAATERVIQRAS